jgi:3-oxoadipate enol-lactonase
MPTCKLRGIEMAYTDRGQGQPLVLLHGFPLDRRVWDDCCALLENQYRVITPDLRGFGQTAFGGPFTIRSLADDVRELLIALDALPCILGGLSMGGYVALAFAEAFASDLNGLILIDTKSAADSTEAKQSRQQMSDLTRSGGSTAVASQMFPKMIAPASRGSAAAAKLLAIMEGCPALTIEHALAAMRDRADYTPMLARQEAPVLIVVGAEDAIASPAIARAMHEATPNSRLAIIPAAGHMAPIEQPAAFAEAVTDRLQGRKLTA